MQLKKYFFLLGLLITPTSKSNCIHAIRSIGSPRYSPSPLLHQIVWFKLGTSELADFLHLPKERATESSIEEDEIFSLFGGAVNLDIKKARQMIRAGTIAYRKETIPITDYAEASYGLSKESGWPAEQAKSAKVGVNTKHAQSISGDRLNEPGIIIE